MNTDLFNRIVPCQLVDTGTKTSTVTTSAVDLSNYDSCDILWSLGLSGDTLSGSVKWTAVVQESDTYNASFAAAAAADVIVDGTTVTANSIVVDAAAEDQMAYHIGYKGTKKYVILVITATGTHTYGTPMAVVALLGRRRIGVTSNTSVPVASS